MKPSIGDKIRIVLKEYTGAYEIGDEFEVLRVLDDWSVKIIGNDGKETYLWDDEFEIITENKSK